MAKHLEQAFLFICIVCAFCVIAMIVAAAYYLIRERIALFDNAYNISEWVFKCIVMPLGIVGIYKVIKYIKAWLDR